ncbi:MAG: hypothetical protein ACT4P7_15420 [Gemmatimonadaceae bacterium]
MAIAYVCIFRASDTLTLIEEQKSVQRYKSVYRILGVAMILSPLGALLLTLVLQPGSESNSMVFLAEALGVVVFGIYWITKGREIAKSDAVNLALEGKLETPPVHAGDVVKEVPVKRVA